MGSLDDELEITFVGAAKTGNSFLFRKFSYALSGYASYGKHHVSRKECSDKKIWDAFFLHENRVMIRFRTHCYVCLFPTIRNITSSNIVDV